MNPYVFGSIGTIYYGLPEAIVRIQGFDFFILSALLHSADIANDN